MKNSNVPATITNFSFSSILKKIEGSTPLECYVLETMLSKENPFSYAHDLTSHGCISGIESKLIYTKDIHIFFDKFYTDIEDLRQEYEDQIGAPLSNNTDLKTFLSWFAFEEIVRKFYIHITNELS